LDLERNKKCSVNFMATATANKSINWQMPPAADEKTNIEEYRAMVSKAENSGFMSYEEFHKITEGWFTQIAEAKKKDS